MNNNKLLTRIQKEIKKSQYALLIGPMKCEGYTNNSTDSPIIFIDGGTKHSQKFKKHNNHFSLGDEDSSQVSLDYSIPAKKDFSDLKLALDLVGNRAQVLFLDGLFPNFKNELRWDHRLANLGECFNWSKINKGFVYLNSDTFIMPKGVHHLEIWSEFSLFSLYQFKLKMTGKCEYQIKTAKVILPFSSLGLSNKGNGKIKISCSEPIIIMAKK